MTPNKKGATADPPAPEEGKDEEDGYQDPPMTIWEHLAELRKRLFVCIVALAVCTGIAWTFRADLLAFFAKPYIDAWQGEHIAGAPTIHFQTPAAGFLAYFKLSMLGGAALAAPILFYELWAFIAPGLYAREKKFVIPFVIASTALFTGGGYFGWRLVFPLAFQYLLGFSGDLSSAMFSDVKLNVQPTVMMGDYIDFVTRMLLGFGLIFEIPLVIFFLSVAGVINYLHLIRYGRWFVVAAFVAAAIITPPDVTSQIMMAIPMVFLYGSSIVLAYFFGKPPSEAQREAYKRKRDQDKLEREQERVRKRDERAAEKAALKAQKDADKEAAKQAKKK